MGAWDLWSPSPSPSSCRVPITNYASSSCSRVKSVQVRPCQTKQRSSIIGPSLPLSLRRMAAMIGSLFFVSVCSALLTKPKYQKHRLPVFVEPAQKPKS